MYICIYIYECTSVRLTATVFSDTNIFFQLIIAKSVSTSNENLINLFNRWNHDNIYYNFFTIIRFEYRIRVRIVKHYSYT